MALHGAELGKERRRVGGTSPTPLSPRGLGPARQAGFDPTRWRSTSRHSHGGPRSPSPRAPTGPFLGDYRGIPRPFRSYFGGISLRALRAAEFLAPRG